MSAEQILTNLYDDFFREIFLASAMTNRLNFIMLLLPFVIFFHCSVEYYLILTGEKSKLSVLWHLFILSEWWYSLFLLYHRFRSLPVYFRHTDISGEL